MENSEKTLLPRSKELVTEDFETAQEHLRTSIESIPCFVPYEPPTKNGYKLVPTDAYQIHIGTDVKTKAPIILNMSTSPHLIVTGYTRTGKSTVLHSILNSLINGSVDDVELHLVQMAKFDLLKFAECHQVVSYCDNLKTTHTMLTDILKKIKDRNELLLPYIREGKVINARDCTRLFPSIDMKPIYIVIDEFIHFSNSSTTLDKETSQITKDNNNMLNSIAQYGSNANVFLIILTHRLSKNIFPSFIKSQCSNIIYTSKGSIYECITDGETTSFELPKKIRNVCKVEKPTPKPQPIINRLETCIFQREEDGDWENGLLINEGEGHLLDRFGNKLEDVWNYHTTSDLVLSNLDMIFDREKITKIREIEMCENETVQKEIVSDAKTTEIYIKKSVEEESKQVNRTSKIGYTL